MTTPAPRLGMQKLILVAVTPIGIIIIKKISELVAAIRAYRQIRLPSPDEGFWGSIDADFPGRDVGSLHPKVQAKFMKKYNRMWKQRVLWMTSVVIGDPEIVPLVQDFPKTAIIIKLQGLFGRSLVFLDTDAVWKFHRKLLSPGFSSGALKSLVPSFYKHGSLLLARLEGKDTIDFGYEFTKTTLDIIMDTGFGFVDFASDTSRKVADALQGILAASASAFVLLPFGCEYLSWKTRHFRKCIDNAIFDCIEQRRSGATSNIERSDLLDLLLNAKDSNGQGLSLQEVRDEVMLFFLAGFETTELTLTWLCGLLSKHPDILAKLIKEVDTVFQGGPIVFEKLKSMEYMTAVLKEALRLYPATTSWNRVAPHDFEFKGIKIPKGVGVRVPHFGIHHDDLYWEDASAFNPDRFLPQNADKRVPNAWTPFTAGSRICLGMDFFFLEAKTLLSTFLQKYTFKSATDEPLPPITNKFGTLHPSSPIVASLVPR